MAKSTRHLPETGVQLVVGRPGAGKSYFMVRSLIDSILSARPRPVYTNLPLQWRVMREYLRIKGGPERAALVEPVTERGFRRFIDRYSLLRKFTEDAQALAHEEGRTLTPRAAERMFLAEHGAHVISGPDLNWIPAGAILMLDELQHWFGNPHATGGGGTKEPKELGAYLQMHRHLSHWVWVATQKERQVSASIKTLADRVWDITNLDDYRIVWNFRFRNLRQVVLFATAGRVDVRGLGYKLWQREEWEDKDMGGKPVEGYVLYPAMPWNVWVFRLYRSHTHAGSAAEQRKQLEQVYEAAGLDNKGRGKLAPTVTEKPKMGCLLRAGLCVAGVFVLLVTLGSFYGAMNARLVEMEERIGTEQAEVVRAQTGPTTARLMSLVGQRARFDDGRALDLPGTIDGIYINEADERLGYVLGIDRDERLWLFKLGEAARSVGAARDVLARVRGDDGAGGGGRVAASERGEDDSGIGGPDGGVGRDGRSTGDVARGSDAVVARRDGPVSVDRRVRDPAAARD